MGMKYQIRDLRNLGCLFISMLIGWTSVRAQTDDLSYKHLKNLPMVKLKSISFLDIPEDDFVLERTDGNDEIDFVPPVPVNSAAAVKNKLDENRKRRYASSIHKYDQGSEDVRPEVAINFDGLPFGSSGIPNDNTMAISNSGMVISAINSSVSILDADGNWLAYRTLSKIVDGQLSNLNRTYDPKAIYDFEEDRFILMFLQGSTSADTRIIVGFSETNDPLGLWHFYAIPGNEIGGKHWSDYPIIGLNKDDLFITVNILRDGESWQEGFRESVIWQIDKKSGFEGRDTVMKNAFFDIKYKDKSIWSICPVHAGSTFNDPNMYFLSVRPGTASNDTVFVHEITNTQASGKAIYRLKVLKTSKPYGVPPSAFQPDPDNVLQTNDTRVLSAFYESSVIQYVQTSLISETGSSGVFHGIINLFFNEVENNYIYSDTMDYGYPSIAFAGDAEHRYASVMTFSHSSELDFPGTSAIFHNKATGQPSLYSPVVKIKEGDVSIDRQPGNPNERWGDYTGIQKKYNEVGVVWMSGSYGRTPNRNGVWIGSVKADLTLTTTLSESVVSVYPNPVVGGAQGKFILAKDSRVKLNLYSVDGKLVQTTYEGDLKAGEYRFKFNGGKYLAGMYYLQVADNEGRSLATTSILIQ
ncbi:MAG: hypothetical protein ACI8ZN_002235 [Bacteroidia bacterium]|jgi:hypothetical protein